MTGQEKIRRAYRIYLRQMPEIQSTYEVSYVPRGPGGGVAKRVPEFKAMAHVQKNGLAVRWHKAPSDPEATQADFDEDVRRRVRPLHEWIERLMPLVSS